MRKPVSWPFNVWLIAFYSAWLTFVVSRDSIGILAENWEIVIAMMFGSFIAGSTPMGGGTIGFPVLVMLLGELPSLGRDFSFCIQSIGMTSAAIWIFCRGTPIDKELLKGALAGVAIGTPAGLWTIANYVSAEVVKLVFASFWGIFGILSIWRIRSFASIRQSIPQPKSTDQLTGFLCGLTGGLTVASMTGVGTDMLIFMVIVLYKRGDLRTAIPTSVVLMAFTSIIGVISQSVSGQLNPAVFPFWLAASPVVILGAPFGTMVVGRIGRMPLLFAVSLLCVFQMVWAFQQNAGQVTTSDWVIIALATLVLAAGLALLDLGGRRLAMRQKNLE